ncbi:hypothetical protein SAMN05216205_5863 [Pseudomonas mohnii]|uniref:Uncharacterized protein n=1 Tax=Pseudomonas mohnii TaxID=395600 RepID=A0ABY0YKC6_9PSED|nr:hypothetical protein SAMN05216205_5863 [Pseudomonas mohnii]
MLTWLSVTVQWHRVIVHRWLASEDVSKLTTDLLG